MSLFLKKATLDHNVFDNYRYRPVSNLAFISKLGVGKNCMLPQSVSPDPGSITFFLFAGSLFQIFKQDPSKFGGLSQVYYQSLTIWNLINFQNNSSL